MFDFFTPGNSTTIRIDYSEDVWYDGRYDLQISFENHTAEPDESGRRKPIVEQNSEFEIKADLIIKALGFDPEELPKLFDEEKLQVTKWGTCLLYTSDAADE